MDGYTHQPVMAREVVEQIMSLVSEREVPHCRRGRAVRRLEAGAVTLPATSPLAGDTVAVSDLSELLIPPFARMVTSLVNGASRLPPRKTAMPLE